MDECIPDHGDEHSRTATGPCKSTHPARLSTCANQVALNQDGLPKCPFDISPIQDSQGQTQLFGVGAWSNVYKATPTRFTTTDFYGLVTPPSSPTVALPIIVAVKQQARNDAKLILKNEATILGYLHNIPRSKDYIVPFYGVSADGSMVLAAYPLSLEHHIRRTASSAEQSLSKSTIHSPVVGSTGIWLNLAHRLVSALTWLHDSANVVHGDIKPGNILLVPTSQASSASSYTMDYNDTDAAYDFDFGFQPLFIDFSSSHCITNGNKDTTSNPGPLSAITLEYAAPELLSSTVLSDPTSRAIKSSDVFSLAISLLVCATGNLQVYDGSRMQRMAMAKQGWECLSLARSGHGGNRVPRCGLVESLLEKAVLRMPEARLTASQWLEAAEKGIRAILADGGVPIKEDMWAAKLAGLPKARDMLRDAPVLRAESADGRARLIDRPAVKGLYDTRILRR